MITPYSIGNFINGSLKLTLRSQHHYNTGKTEQGVTFQVVTSPNSQEIIGYADSKAFFALHHGVKPNRIPYGGQSGVGRRMLKMLGGNKRSEYIEGLIQYFKSKGRDDVTAKRMAFATARKQKEKGSPKRGLNHIQITFDRIENQLDTMVGEMCDQMVKNLIFSNHFKL